MSRLWTVIGIGILALALAACGGGGEEEGTTPAAASPTGAAAEGTEPAAPTGTVSIDFWHSEISSTEETFKRLVDRFNASQDEVKVNLLYQGNNTELILKLITSIQSHNVPALVELAEVDTQIAVDSGGVTPVQKFIDAEGYDLSDFDQKAIDYYTVDDELYGVPFAIAVPMLFYNKIPFREVGLDPEQPPLTIDDVTDYSEKLYEEDGAGNVVRSGMALDMNPWYLEVMLAEHGDLYVNNNNGRDGRPTEALFDNDAGRTVFRWWKDMVDSGLGFNVGRNPSGADALLAMGAGRTAMAVSGSSALRSVLDVLEAGLEGVELGVGPFPAVPGGTGVPGIFGRSLWITNGRPEEEQEAAWKVARWFAEPEQQAELFAGSGYLPARISAYDLEQSQEVLDKYPSYQVPVDLFVGKPATAANLGPRIGPFPEVRDAVVEELEAVVVGGKDPDEALADAASRATEELQRYNERVE
jgi:sn-glycerol 3-phosphate transport system substrate-binding protein